jgi:hypothetical protein
VKLSLCLINSALCHEDIWENGGIAPSFLIFGKKNLKERDYVENRRLDGRIILKWVSEALNERTWTGFI